VPKGDQPLFIQLKDRLREDILAQRLQPGQKLPSESQLQSTYGVSRITVRQALAELGAAGLIQKVNGKGSFVAHPRDNPDLGLLTGFYEHMRARGHVARGKLLSVREVEAPARVARALGLPPGTQLVRANIVKSVDGIKVAYGFLMAPKAMMDRLLEHDLEFNDAMLLLETRLGHRLHFHDIETSALGANTEQATRLDVAPGTPLLRVTFIPHDIEQRALAYSEYVFRGDRFSYKARVHR
jgi:GntR family transcriptional regulator